MKKVYREDRFTVDKVIIDGFGILRSQARIARIGIQDYWENGKIIRELRLPQYVKDSAESFSHQIVTLDHPDEFVDSDNANKYSKGLTGRVEYKDGYLEVPITITHRDAVEAAKSTHKQFSCGYFANVIDEPGKWVDELGVMGIVGKEYEYDRYQTDIVGNHIALVPKARAGDNATFINDSVDKDKDFIIIQENAPNKENRPVVQFVYKDSIYTIEGSDAEKVVGILDGLKAEIEKEKTESADLLGKLEAKVDTLTSEKSTLEGKLAGLEAKKDSSEMTAEVIAAEVESRLAIWDTVKDKLDGTPDYKLDATEVKKLYLKKELPQLAEKIDNADKGYIDGLWDSLKPEAVTTKVDGVKETLKDSAKVVQIDEYEAARAAYLEARKAK